MPPPLKPEAVDEKRRAIIASARLIASQQGLEAAKMSDIARDARVSKGTLYRFFESKEDLLLAVVLEGQAELVPLLIERRKAAGSPIERLLGMAEIIVQTLGPAVDRVVVDIQAVGLAARDSSARSRLEGANRSAYDAVHDELRAVIEEGIANGLLRPDLDADAAAAAMVAVRDGVVYRASFDEARKQADRARSVFRVVVDGMLCQQKNA